METNFRNLIILKSIDELRNVKKLRPDKDKIISYATREYGLDERCATEGLIALVDKKLVYLKSAAAGQESYFINNEVDTNNMGNNGVEIIRDTSAFRILEKFGDIINNLNQQLHEEKVLNRSLATENFDLKVKMEKLISEKRNLAGQTEGEKEILNVSEDQNQSGIKFSTGSVAQTRVAWVQTSPLLKTSPKRSNDKHIPKNNNKYVTQESITIQLKEIQAIKHQQYMLYKSQVSTKENSNTIKEKHQTTPNTK